jgi:hypothetical protein
MGQGKAAVLPAIFGDDVALPVLAHGQQQSRAAEDFSRPVFWRRLSLLTTFFPNKTMNDIFKEE